MSQVDDLIGYLRVQIGKPYVLGANGPEVFDCSSLTQVAFKESCNIDLPRVSTDQYAIGSQVELEDLREGDLIFFDTGASERVPNHVGVCIGNSIMINANSYYGMVKEETYKSSYWQNCYYGAKRVLDDADSSTQVFSDVPETYQFYQYIMDLYDNGVVQGYDDGTFRPESSINRTEFLKIVLDGFDISLDEVGEVPFSDVDKNAWYFKYILTGYKKGIVQGYPDGKFYPGNDVNRAEALKMAIETAGIDISNITDVSQYEDLKKEDWFYEYVCYALEKDLIAPVSDTKFGSVEAIKRGEMCKVVSSLMEI